VKENLLFRYCRGVAGVTALFSGLGALLLAGYWLAAELFPEMVDGYALT
jgi:hypothetical protein